MVLNTPSAQLLSAIVAVICLWQHVCLAPRAFNMGLFNLGPAYHAEPSLYRQICTTLTAFVDDHYLVPAVRAEATIKGDVGMTLCAFHCDRSRARLASFLDCFLEDSWKHHS